MRAAIFTRFALLALAAFCAVAGATALAAGETISREEIIGAGERMADAQLAQLAGKKRDIGWIAGVMWAGYADLSHVSTKPEYAEAIEQLGEAVGWTPQTGERGADTLCICQTFLDAYVAKNDPARLSPSRDRLDAVCETIEKGEGPFVPGAKDAHITWWWCDSLFMEPASHARLSVITKDPKYLDAMNMEWWKTADLLYDEQEHLFFRDKRSIGKRTKNGRKVFWSRGNGWVFAGLARTLTYMPADYPGRARYVAVFKQMAAKLASLQQADGTWWPSLLAPEDFPYSETSGTALDCFAYAWGINNGILDGATYLPVATKAWAALLAARRADGLPGYVQRTAAGPGVVRMDGTQLYATGAFLMAACELSKLAPITVPELPKLTAAAALPAVTPVKY